MKCGIIHVVLTDMIIRENTFISYRKVLNRVRTPLRIWISRRHSIQVRTVFEWGFYIIFACSRIQSSISSCPWRHFVENWHIWYPKHKNTPLLSRWWHTCQEGHFNYKKIGHDFWVIFFISGIILVTKIVINNFWDNGPLRKWLFFQFDCY